jgi:hypothetical protein
MLFVAFHHNENFKLQLNMKIFQKLEENLLIIKTPPKKGYMIFKKCSISSPCNLLKKGHGV